MKPTETTPTLRDLAARAGYYHHIDIDRLTADLRGQPGCCNLQPRNLQNYLAGKTRVPATVAIALARLLDVDLEMILRGSK